MYQVISALAEFERDCIRERVLAGNAEAKGRKFGRPRLAIDAARIGRLRSQQRSWPQIARELGLSVGTVYQAARTLSKHPLRGAAASD